MDLLSYFSTEPSTWPDTSLKPPTKHLCFWWSSSASDKYYCLHLVSDWTGLGRHWHDGMEKICYLYRMLMSIRSVRVPKIWVEYPSNTPSFYITIWLKPKMTTMKIWKLIIYIYNIMPRVDVTWHSESLQAERSGVQIPLWMWFFCSHLELLPRTTQSTLHWVLGLSLG